LDVLPKIFEDVQAGKKEKIGFAFIDADKGNDWNYFDWAVKRSVPRACIVVDNVVSRGNLADAESTSNMVLGGRKVVENVGKDERVDATVLQSVGEKDYDGFLLAIVK